ncbi:sigma factor-like helix-turn-helix DNA-binding protein [[Mycoplasma] anseris]|uniref:Uncharacterized protein n=1 Tax=[Mycoplasma] anseris TaxID=92400 RepID=A0A2Z4NDI6_9BACT|nr:sigma factor-like helix-turn-helix DNA-binding protein [[Mycoplasma] anseris]AWX69568.1 hypothetical protein DP065_02275 [[Mycoplasma] anseris]
MNKDLLKEKMYYSELFEKYGNLLSQSQRQTLDLYLNQDLSITEIAEEFAMTRSGVHDAIKKGRQNLEKIQKNLKQN